MVSDLTQCDPLSAPETRTRGAGLLFSIPPADQQEFAEKLSQEVRDEVNVLLSIVKTVFREQNKQGALRAVAFRNSNRRGWSLQSLARKYYAYIKSGDWRVLVDRAKAGPAFWATDERVGLPAEFVQFWKALCERNQRATAPARRELLKIWREHRGICPATGKIITYKKILGYDTWPEIEPGSDAPRGWSAANLNRHAPSKFELTAARQGRDAASLYTRKVFTTRAGLRVGQFYLFDDQEYDQKVNFPGSRLAMRPVGLNVLDLFSACCIAWTLKPVLIDDDGVKKKGLEQYMPFLGAHVLCNLGYIPEKNGTTLIVESGTATYREAMIERIAAATNDCVIVHRGQTSNTPAHAGQFHSASKGNPRFKASLESFINYVRNEFAALPGQVGLSRERAPAEMYGRDRANTQLLKAAALLAPERAALLRLPYLPYFQFREIACELYTRINNRTDHDLEGWAKCGHVLQEFMLNLPSSSPSSASSAVKTFSESDWHSLNEAQRSALAPLVTARCRKLSPQEVWNNGATSLQKLGSHMLPVLLGPELGEERRVVKGYITIENQDLDSDPFRFPASSVLSPQSSSLNLAEGSTFLTYQNPFAPDTLILADSKGRYVGELHRQETPCRADADKVAAQIKYASAALAQQLAPVAQRAVPIARARLADLQHNQTVFEGQPVTPEEKESAQKLRALVQSNQAKTDLTDMLSDAPGANDFPAAAAENHLPPQDQEGGVQQPAGAVRAGHSEQSSSPSQTASDLDAILNP